MAMRWLDMSSGPTRLYKLDVKDDNVRLVLFEDGQDGLVANLTVQADGKWLVLDTTRMPQDTTLEEAERLAYENAKQVIEQHLKLYNTWLTALRKA